MAWFVHMFRLGDLWFAMFGGTMMTERLSHYTKLWVALVALAAAALGGCAREDYYCDANGCYFCDGVGCRRVAPTPRTNCTSDAQCAAGQTCTPLGCATTCSAVRDCQPQGRTCSATSSADGGTASGICIAPGETTTPACRSNTDCMAGAECINGMCQRTTTPACRVDTDCTGGNVCLSGRCVPPANQCNFDNQCGTGRVCINNECRAQCDAGRPCAQGQTCTAGVCRDVTGMCTNDAGCASGQRCVNGACLQTCTVPGGTCPSMELFCSDDGLCRPDTRPRPFCTSDAQCSSLGSRCVSGLCRVPCTTSDMCASVDVTFRNCGRISYLPTNTQTFCITDREFRPLCSRQSECPSGQNCVNGACQ